MKDQAVVFTKDSTQLNKEMRKRKWKTAIMLTLVCLAIIAFIVVPIVVR